MTWQIEFSDQAFKQLKKIDHQEAKRITQYLRKRIEPLDDPRQLGKPLKGTLVTFWRYHVGNYRLVCEFQNERLVVLVVRLGHRKGIYD